MHVRRRTANAVAATALLSLALAACGGSPTAEKKTEATKQASGPTKAEQAYEKFGGLTGEARKAELVKLAEAEGKLSIYTSNTDMDKLVEEFEDLYDIDVSVYRGNSESVIQRVIQEQKAGFHGNDLFETNALELNIANKEGFLAPYKSDLLGKVRKEALKENWVGTRFNTFVVGWNTKLVKPGEEPKTIEELAEPKWKGKISMEISDVDWFTALYDHFKGQGKSEKEIEDLFRGLANNSKIVKGHTVQGELLSAGQFAVTLSSYSHTIDKAADKGAPVAWRPASGEPVQPLVVRPNGIGLMKTASNPAAATLFVDFELQEGQKVFAEAFRVGSVPTGKDALEGLDVVAVPEEKLLNEGKKWDELYARLLEGGEKVKE